MHIINIELHFIALGSLPLCKTQQQISEEDEKENKNDD